MLSKEYALALFDFSRDLNKLDLIFDEFKVFADSIKENDGFINIMSHPKINVGEKKELIKDILKSFDVDFKYFIYVLIDNGRFEIINIVYDEFVSLINKDNNIMVVKVFTKEKINSSKQDELKQKLESIHKKKIKLEPIVDNTVIGGIRLEFNGKILDDTFKRKLEDLKSKLV